MHDAWTVLELSPSADEATIRSRYLELVRKYPPDREPEKFQELREAYDHVRDPLNRWRSQLIDLDGHEEQLDLLVERLRREQESERFPTTTLLRLAELP